MKKRRIPVFVLTLFLAFGVFMAHAAEPRGVRLDTERYALLIGNADYEKQSALKNPINDVRDMAAALKSLDFHVVKMENARQREIEDAVQKMGDLLRKGGEGTVGLFYFAGHGVQSENQNYLIPIGANIEKETDIRYMAVNANWVLESMSHNSESLNIVILDACRSKYPFTRQFRDLSRSMGLAPMTSELMSGALVAFATSPGKVSSDGDGRNGIFTKYLLKHIRKPGMGIEDILKQVRIDVAKETGKEQIPWSHSSLLGEFYFIPPQAPPTAAKQYGPVPVPANDSAAAKPQTPVPAPNTPRIVKQDSRYVAYENGTVVDSKTGLMWTQRDNGENLNWRNAKKQCENLRIGGYTDWRLPTLSELKTLFSPDSPSVQKCNQKYPIYLTKMIDLSCGSIWAADTRESAAAFFNFTSGNELWYYQTADMARTLAVRPHTASVAAAGR